MLDKMPHKISWVNAYFPYYHTHGFFFCWFRAFIHVLFITQVLPIILNLELIYSQTMCLFCVQLSMAKIMEWIPIPGDYRSSVNKCLLKSVQKVVVEYYVKYMCHTINQTTTCYDSEFGMWLLT